MKRMHIDIDCRYLVSLTHICNYRVVGCITMQGLFCGVSAYSSKPAAFLTNSEILSE